MPESSRPAIAAALDPQRHAFAELGEFADLDRCAERAGAQFVAQPFIGITRIRLDEADDRQIDEREADRVEIRHAQQAAIAHPHRQQHVELGRGREPAEGQQDAEHQPDRDAEREIFGDQIGEHAPYDADRAALLRDEIEQPQHLLEQQQHGRDNQGRGQGHSDQAGDVAIDERTRFQIADAPSPCSGRNRDRSITTTGRVPPGRVAPGL
jgi:hypothetical protein